MTRINCYLIELDDRGQIRSSDLVYSETDSDGYVSDPKIDQFMLDTYNAILHSVYFRAFESSVINGKGADVLRFYKNH